ncbi:cytochrome P450 [Variovorax sp. Sphag1AA]|uniref:cytochrome P450 n=1 Tax=Variovorax sp. Sphag1AA TaxID=2587027 RepID=UPI00161CD643|nr:cytochrome P450 [Variovorax sp. Sphag1AA]MBB3177984.1 hypothetical protein [Variovorax sp. Sphag1AA]
MSSVIQEPQQSPTPTTAFDLFDLPEHYYDDPYPFFKTLRDEEPVHWNSDGSVLVTRYADVKAVWRDLSGVVNRDATYREKFGEGPLLEHHTSSMLFKDPPDHDRLRDIVNPFFTPSGIERLRQSVREIVEQLLEELEGRTEIDYVTDFASRIPVQVICDIFGVPRSDGSRIRDWGAQVLFPLNPRVSADAIAGGNSGAANFKAYLLEHINEWRRRPVEETPSNVISALVKAEKTGHAISENEMAHMCILLLNGGHETTTNLIGLSTLALLRNRDQFDVMAQDEAIVSSGVEECLRYTTPLQLQGRRTTRAVTLPSGASIPAGVEIIIAQASANRDERVFQDPDRLDLARRPNPHLSFGAGIHVCLGRPLARLEASIALPAVTRRFPRMDLRPGLAFNTNARFRGIRTMPVVLS